MKLDIPYLLQNLTVEEKAGLCSGADSWHTKAVERLGLPAIMVSDGPHGLRKQAEKSDHLGVNNSIQAVCFPAGSALASSFDRALLSQLGDYLAEEARAEGVHTVLGPAINMKRSPLCGRNFEYMSEDPYLAGELSASYVKGVQSKNVGVSVKHYAANNQEFRRMSVDTLVDERTLREIYFKAFEITVKKSKPWTIMCAYNKLNGVYCCENEFLLKKVLREEWGFDGIVMSDWGAMNERVDALKAGLNLEMPSSYGLNDRKIVKAVKDGELSIAVLDHAVEELLQWIEKGLNEQPEIKTYDKEAHHEASRKMAAQCAVLLKNDKHILPLRKEAKAVFIGPFAKAPRFQGGGSSHINCFKITSAMEAAGLPVTYAAGIEEDGITANKALLQEAVGAASEAEVAVIFAGLPDSFESEGYDRNHMDMPECQNTLIKAIAAVQPNTVVVLHNGSPIAMPWQSEVPAILEMYLGGQAVGAATIDLLYGKANPSGKLAETFPLRLADTPCYPTFPGDGNTITYGEGVFVGYRWYDSRNMEVAFPFGHGLSYTNFMISDLKLSAQDFKNGDTVTASVKVKNTGSVAGAEVVQLYVSPPEAQSVIRPVQELKGFEKICLNPGEEKMVTFTLTEDTFAYWNAERKDWFAAPGIYEIRVGSSSREIATRMALELKTKALPFRYTESTTLNDVINAGLGDVLSELIKKAENALGGEGDTAKEAISSEMLQAMLGGMPIHSLASFVPISEEEFSEIMRQLKR